MKDVTLKRRIFLKGIGALGVLLAIPSGAWSFFVSKFPVRTVEEKNFTFDPESGMLTRNEETKEPYQLVVDGLVEEPFSFSYQQLQALPQTSQISDFHCVEGWSVKDLGWGGIRFEEIVNRVKPKPDAKFAVFHALGETRSKPKGHRHYLESMPISQLLDPKQECLLVLSLDGQPLPLEHGAPLRLIAPYQLAYKSIKFVNRIEFTKKPQPGWWTLANPVYPIDAPVPEEMLRKQ